MDDENFDPVAQSRANYYTPGSPIQFVRVELLRGESSGSNAVCLTFKNIGQELLYGLKVHFKCKDAKGNLLCEDGFSYENLHVGSGDLFGMDEAVFVTEQQIGSVDVVLLEAVFSKHQESLEPYKRVRLPAAKRLPKGLADRLQQQIGRKTLKFMPQILENGWYCACGAFHPNEENTVYCSECGSDRILLQNALSSLMQPEASQMPTEPDLASVEEPTRVVSRAENARAQQDRLDRQGATREVTDPYQGEAAKHFHEAYQSSEEEEYEMQEEEYESPSDENAYDEKAEALIRWVPAVTALLCALIAFGGFLYCQFFLN